MNGTEGILWGALWGASAAIAITEAVHLPGSYARLVVLLGLWSAERALEWQERRRRDDQ